MIESSDDKQSETVWFAGLPVATTRAFEAHEAVRLSRVGQRLRIRGLLLTLAVPLSLLIVTAIGILIDLAVTPFPELRTLGALLLTLLVGLEIGLVLPITIASAFRSLKRYRLTEIDLARGEISVCTGRVRDFAMTGRAARRIARGLHDLDPDETLTIEVLPVSSSLWTVDGVPVEVLAPVLRGATSATPEFASIAARWTRPLETLRGLVQYNRRSLSDEEKAELRSYLPRMARRYVWLGALHLLLFYQLSRFMSGDQFYAALALLSATVAFFADRRMLRIVSFQRRLRTDLEEGWVLIVKASEEEHVPAIEYLPSTGAEWTHAGTPSMWRKMYGKFRT